MSVQLTKRQIYEACLAALESRSGEAQSAMAESQKAANEYGAPHDRYDSFRTQVLARRDMYARQYDEALRQLEILKKIDPDQPALKVEFGAVVLTSSQLLFVSVGLGKLALQGVDFFAISPQVPLFETMRDKKSGDRCLFRGVEFTILDIL